MFTMFYAERLGDKSKGEPYIAERGVFYSIAEFAPYRAKGWEGTTETNAAADAHIRATADWPCRRCGALNAPEYESCGQCGLEAACPNSASDPQVHGRQTRV